MSLMRLMKVQATRCKGSPCMAGTDDDRRFAAAYFEFYFLAMRSGHCRTPAHLRDLLRQAGFSRISERRTGMPLFAGLLVARV